MIRRAVPAGLPGAPDACAPQILENLPKATGKSARAQKLKNAQTKKEAAFFCGLSS
jgi:hypothetical protein